MVTEADRDAALSALLTDQVAATAAQRASTPELSSRRPPRRRIELVWAGVVAAVAIIAIVVGAVSLSALQRRADPATPQLRQPAQPFGGDCDRLLGWARASDLVGTTLSRSGTDDVPVQLAGGLTCTWTDAEERHGDAGVRVVAVPAALRGTRDGARRCSSNDVGKGSQPTCSVETVSGATWITGSVTLVPGASRAQAKAAAAQLETELAKAGGSSTALPARPENAWNEVDCTALSSRAELAAVLGRPGLTVDPANSASKAPPSASAAADWSRTTGCIIQDPNESSVDFSLELHAYPAGAWLEPEIVRTKGVFQISTDARLRLYSSQRFSSNEPGLRVAWAFQGPNALQLVTTGFTDAQISATANALLRVLDRTR